MAVADVIHQNQVPHLAAPTALQRGGGDPRIARLAEAIPQRPNIIIRVWRVAVETMKKIFGKISWVFFSVLNWFKPLFGARALAAWIYVRSVWDRVLGQIREENLQDRIRGLGEENERLRGRIAILTDEKVNLQVDLQFAQEKNANLERAAQVAIAQRNQAIADKAELDPQIDQLKQTVLDSMVIQQAALDQRNQAIDQRWKAQRKIDEMRRDLEQRDLDLKDLKAAKGALAEEIESLKNELREAQTQLVDYQTEEMLPERYDKLDEKLARLLELAEALKANAPHHEYDQAVDGYVEEVKQKKAEYIQMLGEAEKNLLPEHPRAHAIVHLIARIAMLEERFLEAATKSFQLRAGPRQHLDGLFAQVQIIPQDQLVTNWV